MRKKPLLSWPWLFIGLLCFSAPVLAADMPVLTWVTQPVGFMVLAIFVLAYALVMTEERTHLKKSKPVLIAASLIWVLIAWVGRSQGLTDVISEAFRHYLLDYAELLLFLIVAMTYINVLEERQVFEALRAWLVRKGFTYRGLFWVTGGLAFFISPIADNMTTALLMGAVVMAVGGQQPRFVLLACINLVIAANAGGAFSPFGDITTLMVWQKNIHASNGSVGFSTFFYLFVPALISWLIPAACMHVALPRARPTSAQVQQPLRRGALVMVLLFLLTIVFAVLVHSVLGLPPVLGMLLGLGLLLLYAYRLQCVGERMPASLTLQSQSPPSSVPYDIFPQIAKLEWDTLLFFYGVIICVGGLGLVGYLALLSQSLYVGLGATTANVLIGLISSVVDNIPVMFAVLNMMPDMSVGQWLLVTMTAGVGGSLLSIGSAAGVALMGQSNGLYTFIGHLKWLPVIALGYVASIVTHLTLNHFLF